MDAEAAGMMQFGAVGMIGAGAWGCALAQVAATGGPVILWARDPATPPTLDELRSFASGRLATYKLPEAPAIVEALADQSKRGPVSTITPPGLVRVTPLGASGGGGSPTRHS